jgi:hypothetical protein
MSAVTSLMREGDALVLGFVNPFREVDALGHNFSNLLPDYVDHVHALHNLTRARGASLIVFQDVHQIARPGPDCWPTLFNPGNPQSCEVKENSWKYSQALENAMAPLASQLPGLFYVDAQTMNSPLCDDRTHRCGAFVPGTGILAYYDDNHLTDAGSQYLGPFWCEFFARQGLNLDDRDG